VADERLVRTVEDVARELDMVVYRLEQGPPDPAEGPERLARAWADLRARLERLRERLEDAARES
jgi:hypothetical protein